MTCAFVAMNCLAADEAPMFSPMFSFALEPPTAINAEIKYTVLISNNNESKLVFDQFKNTQIEGLAISDTPTLKDVLKHAFGKIVIDGKRFVLFPSPASRIESKMFNQVLQLDHPPDTKMDTLLPQILTQLGAIYFAVGIKKGRLGNPKDWAFERLTLELY